MGWFQRTLFVTSVVLTLLIPSEAVFDNTTTGAQCLQDRTNDMLTIRLNVDISNDPINYVFGCREYANGTEELVPCHFVLERGRFIVVQVQTSIKAGEQGQVAARINGCGITAAQVNNDWEYTVKLLFLQDPVTYQFGDAAFISTCRESHATQEHPFTNTLITKPIPRTITPEKIEIVLKVVGLDEQTNEFQQINQAIVGQDLELWLVMTLPRYIEHLYPCGLTITDLLFSLSDDFTNPYVITGQDSCPFNKNILDLSTTFSRYGQATSQGVVYMYKSGAFDSIFRRKQDPNNPSQMWFGVSVEFCFGSTDCATRCDNFCAFNNGLQTGRRKRQVEGSNNFTANLSKTYRTMITVVERETEDTSALSNTMIIVIAVAVSVVVIAIMVVLATVYICKTRRQDQNYYQSNSSLSSSRHVKPNKY